MGLMEAILCGLLALTTSVLALVCLRKKLFVLSGLVGACTLLLTVLSRYNWRLALLDSGKNVAWLGFRRYPLAPLLLLVMAAVGLFCIWHSVQRLSGKQK